MLVMLSRLPKDSDICKTMTNKANTMLWLDLPHPLTTVVSPDHRFRSADGSGNNIWNPELGKGMTELDA
jgi:linoleate 10R-lipoxygenase